MKARYALPARFLNPFYSNCDVAGSAALNTFSNAPFRSGR
jgi:hypothetical protein